MLRSGDTLTDGEVLTADVVVVGAGPIGIVTALELADTGHLVMLAESGGDKRDPRADALGDSASQDPYHVAKQLAVQRGVGGTSALWGGRCLPFDPIDFEARPAVPEDLWPVSYDEIAPYFERTCDWFVCGKPVFNAKELPELAGKDMIPGLADGAVRTTDLERWSLPTRFGPLYRKRLEAHARIDLVTNLTCTEIVQDESCAVDHLVLKTLGGVTVTARAEAYILAAGGLECTRLLMASRGRSPNGIGGDSGHLGRWYMAHVVAKVAEMHLSTPPDQTIYSHELDADGVYVRRRFTFSRELQQREPIPNGATWFVNPPLADDRHGSGILSGVYLTLISPVGGKLLAEGIRRAGTKAVRPTSVRAHLRNIVRDLVPAAKFAVTFTYERFLRRGRKAPGFFVRSASNLHPLHYHGEHRPHWESHVALSSEVDVLGMPRLDVQLVFDDEDVASVARALELIDRQVRDAGVGHVEYLHDDLDAAVRDYLKETAGYHQTGTTRMSRNSEQGVVDRDLTVWGTPNLFVASTSVLPTSSQANPTFMGVAFALRLTDMLDRRLREGSLSAREACAA
jgi:hypothetical protein